MTGDRWPDGCPRIDAHERGGHTADSLCVFYRPDDPPAEPDPAGEQWKEAT